MNALSQLNAHERDRRIQFFSEGHLYKIDNGAEKYTSVTTFIKSFFTPFDADGILQQMVRSGSFVGKYGDKTIEDVKAEWKRTGIEAAEYGTLLHESIEFFYNLQETDRADLNPKINPEYQFFRRFHREHVIPNQMKAFRTEWYIFAEDHRIAGSIDMVYRLPNGKLCIYDWKRSKKIEYAGRKPALHPIAHLDDCNFYHYSLQLNLYKYILQSYYNFEVERLCLVFLHPNNPTYVIVEVPDLQLEIEAMLFHARNNLPPNPSATPMATSVRQKRSLLRS